ncbi:MAG: inositol monophosphatase family protein [Pseudomonadota bacterium]|nr:inositol monophosphatase family protein [Pseudomonadota bacterium]
MLDRQGLKTVEAIALQAGKMAEETLAKDFKISEKGPGDLVTEIDHMIDAFLKEELLKFQPTYGWLSEETEEDPSWLEKPYAWVVDPIDGTSNMVKTAAILYGDAEGALREFCISVGLVDVSTGEPVMGVIYNPLDGKGGTLLSSLKGEGVFLDEQPFTHKDEPSDPLRLIVSHGRAQKGLELPKPVTLVPCGSVAYRISSLVMGGGDVTMGIKKGGNPWDIAAAHAIALEAGLKFLDLHGDEVRYTEVGQKIFGFMCMAESLEDEVKALYQEVSKVAKSL